MFTRVQYQWRQRRAVHHRWREFREEIKEYKEGFSGYSSHEDRKKIVELFSRVVRIVEIEPHNFCNRTCAFCGNSVLDRKSTVIPMPDKVYKSILGSLALIDYDKEIRFARYSEPTARKEIIDIVAMAKTACPSSYVKIITNGDYLNPELLNGLAKAGLDRAHVSVYLPNRLEWTPDNAMDYCERLSKRMHCQFRKVTTDQHCVEGVFDHSPFDITFNCVNYMSVGLDRGQEVTALIDKQFTRIDPCEQIFRNVTIDFDGTLMPCCNVRGDDPAHKDFAFGQISDGTDLFEVWSNQIAHKWRLGLSEFSPKGGPCRSCTQLTLKPLDRLVTRIGW